MTPRTRSTAGFQHTPLYRRREPHALRFLAQRSSFWIATLSLIAFLVGNMVGQHGWYAFWASVMGRQTVAYQGISWPLKEVVNYKCWARYGGDYTIHTFRQVPQECIEPYDPDRHSYLLSVDHAHGYSTGIGSHPGVDIRVPEGTPVYVMSHGVVETVKSGGGFGKLIVVRHDHAPDPNNPRRTTTLYSSYAHLSAMLVQVGDTVHQGQKIALSGKTGVASGPHLHWQIDRDTVAWHPYWPFSGSEARTAGYTFHQAVNAGLHRDRLISHTVHPIEYVKADLTPVTLIASADIDATVEQPAPAPRRVSRRSSVTRRENTRPARLRFGTAKQPTRRQRSPENSVVASRQVRLAPSSRGLGKYVRERTAARLLARRSRQRYASSPLQTSPVVVSREEVVSADVGGVPAAPVSQVPHTATLEYDNTTFDGPKDIRVVLRDEDDNVVTQPVIQKRIYLRTGFGQADFQPPFLKAEHFKDGVATVRMVPRGRRTIVPMVYPFEVTGEPLQWEG